MRVVLDTSVIVAGLRSQAGASWHILKLVAERRLRIAASPAVFLEYEQVLNRSEHQVPTDQVSEFLSELAAVLDPVQIHFLWRPQLADADDEEETSSGQLCGLESMSGHPPSCFNP
jgi:putative PIN family toxin of toxin-antitoxin system